jgi:CheY-like chemotaxis protein
VAHTILIVEDEDNQRKLYVQEFEDAGYTVVEAANGREALEKVEEARPDLVILDICMPGMDGIEALGKMLSTDARIPVVLNTAYGTYKENFMSWAADAYVVKSADLTELKRTVAGLLEAGPGA